MLIKSRTTLFGLVLGNALATGNPIYSGEAPETKRDLFAPNLYKIEQQATRTKCIIDYIAKLSEHTESTDKRFSDCKSLLRKLEKEVKKQKETSEEIIQTLKKAKNIFESALLTECSTTTPSKLSSFNLSSVNFSSANLSSGTFGKYPEATCNILELEDYVQNKPEFIASLFKKCKADSTKNDPEIMERTAQAHLQLEKNSSSFAYLDNRIADLNASHVQIGNKVNFVLAAGPKDTEEIRDHLYHAIIEKECSLWFTVNERHKTPFWTAEKLTGLELPENWKIEHVKEEVIEETPFLYKENKELIAKLVKTTLLASNGVTEREIIHYNYDNWKDHHVAPCEKILLKCAEIASNHLSKTGTPVGINCTAGISRTGTLATLIYGMRHIQEEIREGKMLKDITINLAELNYDLRKQRQHIIGNDPKFIQVWRTLGNYVKELQAK